MKLRMMLGLALLAVQGLVWGLGVDAAEAECVEVYFSLYDPGQDPPCSSPDDLTGYSINVTSSPSSVSAGSCFNATLDNLYTSVDFYTGACGAEYAFTCDIVATESILAGYYTIDDDNGACLTVCANCSR